MSWFDVLGVAKSTLREVLGAVLGLGDDLALTSPHASSSTTSRSSLDTISPCASRLRTRAPHDLPRCGLGCVDCLKELGREVEHGRDHRVESGKPAITVSAVSRTPGSSSASSKRSYFLRSTSANNLSTAVSIRVPCSVSEAEDRVLLGHRYSLSVGMPLGPGPPWGMGLSVYEAKRDEMGTVSGCRAGTPEAAVIGSEGMKLARVASADGGDVSLGHSLDEQPPLVEVSAGPYRGRLHEAFGFRLFFARRPPPPMSAANADVCPLRRLRFLFVGVL